MILTDASQGEKSFATLAEAVLRAGNGDSIEVRGDGPYVSPAIPPIWGRRLTIRAGPGARPVLRRDDSPSLDGRAFLYTDSDLVLEGLELQQELTGRTPILRTDDLSGSSLYIGNCRFLQAPNDDKGGLASVQLFGPLCMARNCEFIGAKGGAVYIGNNSVAAPQLCVLDNSVFATGNAHLILLANFKGVAPSRVRLTNSSFSGWDVINLACTMPPKDGPGGKQYAVEASGNVFAAGEVFVINYHREQATKEIMPKIRTPADAAALLQKMVDLKDRGNVYGGNTNLFTTATPLTIESETKFSKWNDLWETAASDSRQGAIHFQGGELRSRAMVHAEEITAADFRLRAGSAGKGAGDGGRDLGADVDLVGPGPAYERWKKMPAYQQWVKDSGQKK